MAAADGVGHAIAQELLRAKLNGQAAVARLLGSSEVAELIINLAEELDTSTDGVQLLGVEGAAAAAYWSLWVDVPLRFARQDQVPEHWRSFGRRNSPLGRKNTRNAVTPANAVLNYLYGVLASELTIALTSVGLDAGLGIYHTDAARRASLTYDAMEAVRPRVDGWLAAWLAEARFSKHDYYEESDGTIRITRPLTSHLAMTAPVWPSSCPKRRRLACAGSGSWPLRGAPTSAAFLDAPRAEAGMARDAVTLTEDLYRVRRSARPETAQVLF
jgi:CRISPR-associated endonuclease Cas1